MTTKPLDKMTKPELVKALKAAHKRIAKLEGMQAAPPIDGRGDQGGGYPSSQRVETSELVPPADDQEPAAFPWNNEPESK